MAYFHELLGHSHNNYTEKERGQAAELLKLYSDEEARALIEHAVREGKKTHYPMQFFGAILAYQESWAATRTRSTCAICQGKGVIEVNDEQGMRMRVCTHGQTAPSARKHELSTLTQPVSVFVCGSSRHRCGVLGRSRSRF